MTRSIRAVGPLVAAGFGVVSIVALLTLVWVLTQAYRVADEVQHMRHDEAAIQQSQELAAAVREQYAHIAHTLIEGDASHLDRYEQSRSQVRQGLQHLAAHAPEAEQWRVTALGEATHELHQHFHTVVLPLLRRGDAPAVRREHRKLETLATEAGRHADRLARAIEARMAHAHTQATRGLDEALIGGGIGAVLLLLLSVGFTLAARSALLSPLAALTDAAKRFGQGDFTPRLGAVGRGELGQLARAFDRMAEELQAREQALVQSERMAAIGQLAAGVAHELNNPIGIIRGYLKTMEPGGDPSVLAEELAILDEEAAACQRITEDLLTFARPRTLHRRPTAIHELLQATAARFTESGKVEILTRLDPANLSIDADRIRQVLLNLLRNAAQAAPDGPIELSAYLAEDHYRIAVRDRGGGIDPEHLERIFEPFFSKRPDGTGLGLAVSRGIVRAHGGTIFARSPAEGGAELVLTLPVGEAQTQESS
ncbi:MAG: HAMP domain-containing protein [Deltaproteobacteria bacterium]|nr:MAG: HAMP domain-containing protein [Deltaproteobacteria bacterium]